MSYNWNQCLPLHASDDELASFSVQDEGLYTNDKGMPFKTAEELERHYYMLGDSRMASMWTIIGELDTALSVASQLE